MSLFERDCQRGEATACSAAADILNNAEGVPEDDARAVTLYIRACELGDWPSCAVGRPMVRVPARAVEGRALLVRGCEGGDAGSCQNLATAQQKGLGGPVDLAAAAQSAARACELGSALGCNSYAVALFEGAGVAADATRARALFELACDAGDSEACGNLGLALRNGLGGPVDAKRAVVLFERGCAGGASNACVALGVALANGEGEIAVDPAMARELFELTCEAGNLEGCVNLGFALRNGLGGPPDAAGAVSLFESGCAAGVWNACLALGAAFYSGEGGLAVDRERAGQLFEMACNGGEQAACDNLLVMEAKGKAPGQDVKPRWSTTIASLTIGSGDQTATFEDVRSTCSAIPLALAFGAAADEARACLSGSASRRVSLSVDAGRLVSSSVEPDDEVGRCVASALGRAPLGELTCAFEATVSR